MKSFKNVFALIILIFSIFSCTPEDIPDHINSDIKISADTGEHKDEVAGRDDD